MVTEFEFEVGGSYIIKSDEIDVPVEVFKKKIEEGFQPLCITTTFPKRFVQLYKLEKDESKIEFIWLCTLKDAKDAVNPDRLDFELTDRINGFIKTRRNCVLLLDGIELLVLTNGFDKVVDFTKMISDLIALNNGIFLVPISAKVFGEDKIATLIRFMECVDVYGEEIPSEKIQPEVSEVEATVDTSEMVLEIENLRNTVKEKEKALVEAQRAVLMREDEIATLHKILKAKDEKLKKLEQTAKLTEIDFSRRVSELKLREERVARDLKKLAELKQKQVCKNCKKPLVLVCKDCGTVHQ
jgi:rubrerythrin